MYKPATFSYDHFCTKAVELSPKFSTVQFHFWIVDFVGIVIGGIVAAIDDQIFRT